jgi:predicted nucleic acid-binding Zn ribbon protein
MPTYVFRNKETGEQFEKIMKISELDTFRNENPQLETVIQSVAFGDPTKLTSSRKFDTGFKEVLQRIHEKTPGSELNKSSSQLELRGTNGS